MYPMLRASDKYHWTWPKGYRTHLSGTASWRPITPAGRHPPSILASNKKDASNMFVSNHRLWAESKDSNLPRPCAKTESMFYLPKRNAPHFCLLLCRTKRTTFGISWKLQTLTTKTRHRRSSANSWGSGCTAPSSGSRGGRAAWSTVGLRDVESAVCRDMLNIARSARVVKSFSLTWVFDGCSEDLHARQVFTNFVLGHKIRITVPLLSPWRFFDGRPHWHSRGGTSVWKGPCSFVFQWIVLMWRSKGLHRMVYFLFGILHKERHEPTVLKNCELPFWKRLMLVSVCRSFSTFRVRQGRAWSFV